MEIFKKAICLPALAVLLCAMLLCACDTNSGNSSGNGTPTLSPSPTGEPAKSGCEVHILSLGKADAILVIADGEAMLIDAGYKKNAEEVIAYIKGQGISRLSYVVLTHGDKDHVGGMADVIREFSVGTVLISPKKEKSDLYEDMISAIRQKALPCVSPTVGAKYALGGAEFQILAPGPKALREGSDNDASIAMRLAYGERSFLLMGDALSTTEKELMDSSLLIRSDVLKTGQPVGLVYEAFFEEVSDVTCISKVFRLVCASLLEEVRSVLQSLIIELETGLLGLELEYAYEFLRGIVIKVEILVEP